MEFKDIEIVKEGENFLKQISHVHPIEIKRVLEDVYEMYKHNFSEYLRDEYDSHRAFDIVYDKYDNITSASLMCYHYDGCEINLTCKGIEVIYKPEDGPKKIIAELPWKVVKVYFNEFLN